MSKPSDVVILIPGFLGFEQLGGFYYFADRVGAAMQGALTAGGHGGVPVVPVATQPSDYLAKRQAHLLQSLARIARRLGPVAGFHLMGHSTGGTDALLLLGEEPLPPAGSWDQLDPLGVRSRIRTVVSICSPHRGTCITQGPLARFFRRPLVNFWAAGSIVKAAALLASAVRLDPVARGLITGALWDRDATRRYIVDVLSARGLVDDLRPAQMSELHDRFRPDFAGVCFRSVVTMAGARTEDYPDAAGEAHVREPDELFELLYRETGGELGFCGGGEEQELIRRSAERLRAAVEAGDGLIRNPRTELRSVTPQLNDGIVNSARQLYDPGNDDELCAVVVGDHFDVLGHYPRWIDASDGESREEIRAGILHSGSGFADPQFFELFARIAQVIGAQL